jgi:gluconokinase
MSRGVPLTDADRLPWLRSIRNAIEQWLAEARNAVLACSALKRSYRDLLGVGSHARDIKLVNLKGSYDLLLERLHSRKGHYMKEQMLSSQLADLEEPAGVITVDVSASPEQIVSEIRRRLGL